MRLLVAYGNNGGKTTEKKKKKKREPNGRWNARTNFNCKPNEVILLRIINRWLWATDQNFTAGEPLFTIVPERVTIKQRSEWTGSQERVTFQKYFRYE